MELQMKQIKGIIEKNPARFIVCKRCKCLNFYTNSECFNCGSEEFEYDDEAVKKEIEFEYDFFLEQGLIEGEIDNISIRVK